MGKYKVLVDGAFAEYKEGDTFEAEHHSVEVRIEKGEVEEIKEAPKKTGLRKRKK